MKEIKTLEPTEVFITIQIYDKNGNPKKVNEKKLVKEVTYTLVDKLIKKDDTAIVGIMEGLEVLEFAKRRKK